LDFDLLPETWSAPKVRGGGQSVSQQSAGHRAECVMLNKGPHLVSAVRGWLTSCVGCTRIKPRRNRCSGNLDWRTHWFLLTLLNQARAGSEHAREPGLFASRRSSESAAEPLNLIRAPWRVANIPCSSAASWGIGQLERVLCSTTAIRTWFESPMAQSLALARRPQPKAALAISPTSGWTYCLSEVMVSQGVTWKL
jgi:hypothetical protein